jgi:hypothetical protein
MPLLPKSILLVEVLGRTLERDDDDDKCKAKEVIFEAVIRPGALVVKDI